MSRHRRQQRKRAGRAFIRAMKLREQWPRLFEEMRAGMFRRAGVSELKPTLATPEQVAEFFGELPTYPKGPDYTAQEWPSAEERNKMRKILENIQPLSAESLNSPLMQMIRKAPEPPAIATADALFGVLGFHRVTDG